MHSLKTGVTEGDPGGVNILQSVETPTWQHISFLCHTTYSVLRLSSQQNIHAPNQITTISPSYITTMLSRSLPIYKKSDKTECQKYRDLSFRQLCTEFYPTSCCQD